MTDYSPSWAGKNSVKQHIVTCQTRTALVKFSLRNLTVYFLLCQLAHLVHPPKRTKGFLDLVSLLPCGLAVYWRPRPLGTRQYIRHFSKGNVEFPVKSTSDGQANIIIFQKKCIFQPYKKCGTS